MFLFTEKDVLDWVKIIETIIPIVTVLAAGLIALYQMRLNIKLQAKVKLKEEFRSVVKDVNRQFNKLTVLFGMYDITTKDKFNLIKPKVEECVINIETLSYDLGILMKKKDEIRNQILDMLDDSADIYFDFKKNKEDDKEEFLNHLNSLFKEYYDKI